MAVTKQKYQSYDPTAMGAAWWMYKGNFMADLNDFFYARIDRARTDIVSRQYAKDQELALIIYDRLKECFPEKGQKDLMALSDSYSNMEAETQEMAYRQGFADALRLLLQTITGPIS